MKSGHTNGMFPAKQATGKSIMKAREGLSGRASPGILKTEQRGYALGEWYLLCCFVVPGPVWDLY